MDAVGNLQFRIRLGLIYWDDKFHFWCQHKKNGGFMLDARESHTLDYWYESGDIYVSENGKVSWVEDGP